LAHHGYHGYDPEKSVVEIGWTFLARKYWGGRYNGEMKRLMLEHAFRSVDRVLFIIGRRIAAPSGAVEKIGAVPQWQYAGSARAGTGCI
jgi:hypothetical protein